MKQEIMNWLADTKFKLKVQLYGWPICEGGDWDDLQFAPWQRREIDRVENEGFWDGVAATNGRWERVQWQFEVGFEDYFEEATYMAGFAEGVRTRCETIPVHPDR